MKRVLAVVTVVLLPGASLAGERISSLAAGESSTCVVRGGKVFCWGKAFDQAFESADAAHKRFMDKLAAGQEPTSRSKEVLRPTEIAGIDRAVQVAVGSGFACVLRKGGQITCFGRLMDAHPDDPRPEPVRGIRGAVQISAAGSNACALTASGQVWCWGENRVGQVGDGTFKPRGKPVRVTGIPRMKQVVVAGNFTCALDKRGVVWCWGYNASLQQGGRLVSGPEAAQAIEPRLGRDLRRCPDASPAKVAVKGSRRGRKAFIAALASWEKSVAADIEKRGKAFGERIAVKILAEVRDKRTRYTACFDSGCILDIYPRPGKVPGVARAMAIAGARDTTCAILAAGKVVCWGAIGEQGRSIAEPQPVTAIARATRISARSQTCAWNPGERALCWRSRSRPETPRGLPAVDQVAVGNGFACALSSKGEVWCWGNNYHGQLGDGTKQRHADPMLVRF